MLQEQKAKLDEHKSGRELLEDDKLEELEKRITAYERKLATMEGELDDREIERMIEREQRRLKRHEERRAERMREHEL